jgi:ubiquinone/menaquinone biosynthesis C-methylase UbiE
MQDNVGGNSKSYFNDSYKDLVIIEVPLNFSITSKKIYGDLIRIIKKSKSIVDLGCGGGGTIRAFRNLNKKALITGIDCSDVALNTARMLMKEDKNISLIDSNLNDFILMNAKYDLVYSSQLLEHIVKPDEFLKNIYNALKPGGILILSTVYRKKWAWYFYKNKFGKRVLAPDHVNEYTNVNDLLNQLEGSGFDNYFYDVVMFHYPLIDPFIKLVMTFIKNNWVIRMCNSELMMKIRYYFAVPILGFYNMQVLLKKQDSRE